MFSEPMRQGAPPHSIPQRSAVAATARRVSKYLRVIQRRPQQKAVRSVVTMVMGSAPRHASRLPSSSARLAASSSRWLWLVSLSWALSVGDRTNVQHSG